MDRPVNFSKGYQTATAPVFSAVKRSHSSNDLMRAHIALLDYEIIRPDQRGIFPIVSYHYPTLQKWHSEYTGWRIEYRGGMFQLLRSPAILPTHFGRRRLTEPADFACLAWILSYAALSQLGSYRGEQQFLLSQLAKYIQDQASDDSISADFDLNRKQDRQSLIRSLKYLENIGALQLVEGQSQEWVDSQREMLYTFTPLTTIFIMAFDAEAVNAFETTFQQREPLQPALLLSAQTLPPLRRAWRALLLGPNFLRYDDPEAFQTLLQQADRVAEVIAETFGWQLEVNRDYACVVRGSGSSLDSSPLLFFGSANDQIIVLLCQAVRAEVAEGRLAADASGCVKLSRDDLEDLFTTSIRPRYGNNWGKEAQEMSAADLLSEVIHKMSQIGLLRGPDQIGNLLILPLAAHFAPVYGERQSSSSERPRRSRRISQAYPETTSPPLWYEEEQTTSE